MSVNGGPKGTLGLSMRRCRQEDKGEKSPSILFKFPQSHLFINLIIKINKLHASTLYLGN